MVKTLFLLSILNFLTFSRASILTLVLFYVLIGLSTLGKRIFFTTCLMFIGFFYIGNYVISDGSFMSKIYIVDQTWSFLKSTSLTNVLFGIGFGNTFQYLGIGAHNFVITYLLESGLIGLTFIFLLWWKILRYTKFRAAVIMVPFLVNGMSLASHAIPYLYCVFAIVYTLEKKCELLKEVGNSPSLQKAS